MSKIELTKEQLEFGKKNREIYNSGEMKYAYEMAFNGFQNNCNDLYYKYLYAVMAGDYSFDKDLAIEKQAELLAVAKKLIKEVFEDDKFKLYPDKFIITVRNEYYFFYKLFEEQFNLGRENVENGISGGHYSMCVGATELAKKYLKEKKNDQASLWATKELHAFTEFEKVDPHWYNINYFAATAFAILGKHDQAIVTFKDMFRKQGKIVDEESVVWFQKEIANLLK